MAGDRHTALFVNEASGGARADRVRRAVELVRSALDAEVHTISTRDAAVFGSWLVDRIGGCSTAIIAGGDGSLGVAYTVAAGRDDLTLGWIPAGFGNATAHLLRMPREPEAVLEVLRRRETRRLDLVGVGDRLALFAGAGWDARVAGRYADAGARGLRGWASAVAQSIPDLWRRPSVEVVADDWTVHRGPAELVVVSTTPYYGRGLRVNPGARPDAGRLSLRVYPGPAARVAIEAARWAVGARPRARRVDARKVSIRSLDGGRIPLQADGDRIGEAERWDLELRPEAVRLIGRWS
jgi:diacylglycerol kinase family enzyme